MKKYDEIKSIGIGFIVLAWLMVPISIINGLFIKSIYLNGFIMGVNFIIITISVIRIAVIAHNEKVEMKEWFARLGYRKDFDYFNRFHLLTKVKDYEISTVDLGINHNFLNEGKPLYYETMVFLNNKSDEYFSGCSARYSTKKEAKKGHKRVVKYVKETLKKKEVKDE